MTDITMPRLSDSMEQGTILRWLLADGDEVARDDDLVEIETDKATVTHQADAAGTLRIVAEEGTTLPVGAVIAQVGDGDGDADAAAGATATPRAEPAPVAVPAGTSIAAPANGHAAAGTAVRATPLARRIALHHGASLAGIRGSGPGGRVLRADVLAALGLEAPARRTAPQSAPAAAPPAAAEPAPPSPAGDAARGAIAVEPLSRLQRVIATRMVQATTTVPHFQVQTEVAMDAAIALRARLKEAAAEGAIAPSLNDLVVKACALALRRHPRANASYREDGFALHERVNVGVAVAADDALLVPAVADADGKSLGEIARETRRLAERVRTGAITPAELSGATFTVSNLGMYGMTAITPVIDPPQSAILGVGALRPVLARVDGEIVDRTLMTLTLSCDHRILYGADAARFLAEVKELLEAPLRLAF